MFQAQCFFFTAVVAMWCAALRRTGQAAAFSTLSRSTRHTFPTAYRRVTAVSMNTAVTTDIIPRVKTADAKEPSDGPVAVKGWVRTVRKQKTLAFVEVNDGSNMGGIQCVLSFDAIDDETQKGKKTCQPIRSDFTQRRQFFNTMLWYYLTQMGDLC